MGFIGIIAYSMAYGRFLLLNVPQGTVSAQKKMGARLRIHQICGSIHEKLIKNNNKT